MTLALSLADFDFDLPDRLIALRPAVPRESARLLHVDPTRPLPLSDHHVHDLPGFLRPGDLMVFNDTRVIPARFDGVRDRDGTRAGIEVTLHKRDAGNRWLVFAKPAKKLQAGDRIRFSSSSGDAVLDATVVEKRADGDVMLGFDMTAEALDAAIAAVGVMPLPPYIAKQRGEDQQDDADYQTIYAAEPGAVAAPTAGLHFTPELFSRLDAAGVQRCFVTLHVGAGTFLPVKVDDISQHKMHAEWGEVSAHVAAQVNATRAAGGRVVAVGTTSLRLLESAASGDGEVRPFRGDTDIFITPGYRFRAVDLLMTNFHLPKSTLFMLVSAFAGHATMQQAYAHAIAGGYRFYSYGDSSLLVRQP